MKKDKAVECAKWRANRYNITYVVIKASNGQWMCERKAYADIYYPKDAERLTFEPEHNYAPPFSPPRN